MARAPMAEVGVEIVATIVSLLVEITYTLPIPVLAAYR
jgi:hypothetical protein